MHLPPGVCLLQKASHICGDAGYFRTFWSLWRLAKGMLFAEKYGSDWLCVSLVSGFALCWCPEKFPVKGVAMPSDAQKLKLLHLAQILRTETDEEHGLTGPQLIEELDAIGVRVERKTLYNDLECLRIFGMNIQKYPSRPVQYRLVSREFEEGEIMLLADAVQSSRFLTERKSNDLVRSIEKLGSKYTAKNLKKRLHVEGRVKSANEMVFRSLDAIQRALSEKRQITFKYMKYDATKKRKLSRDGKKYLRTPVQLIYLDDCYYLVAWSDEHQGFANFRVDRMVEIEVAQVPAARNQEIAGFNVGEYLRTSFRMYSGKAQKATLRVANSAIDTIIDRFGKDVDMTPYSEEEVRVRATVMESPTFFGWLATLGTSVIIEQPQSLRRSYAQYLQRITEAYGEE